MNSNILVGYLEESNPTVIGELRKKFPGNKQILSGVMEFGAAAKKAEEIDVPSRVARFELIKATGDQLIKDIDSLVLVMKSSMLLVRRIRLCSAIVAVVTGVTSAILAFITHGSPFATDKIAVGVATITAFSGLLGVFADHFERTPIGVKFGGVEELTSLVSMRTDIEKISIRVRQDDLNPCSDDEIKCTIGLVNDIALKVLRLKYLSPS